MDPLIEINLQQLWLWGMRLAVLLICLPVHEFAHAWAAHKLGDNTAERQGRLTLNPFVHLDIIGGIVLMIVGFGWAKPVPVNVEVFEHPRRDMALVAAAGPLSNIIMATVMLAVIKVIENTVQIGSAFPAAGVTTVLYIVLRINLLLAVFNLLPVPPLDGSKFFGAFLPERAYFGMMRYERLFLLILLVLIITRRLGDIIWGLSDHAFRAIDFITKPIELLLGG